MSLALHRIDYMLDSENEMELSEYDIHCDPQVVVDRVRKRLAALSKSDNYPVILSKDGHDFTSMILDQAGHTCVNICATTGASVSPPCQVCQTNYIKKNK